MGAITLNRTFTVASEVPGVHLTSLQRLCALALAPRLDVDLGLRQAEAELVSKVLGLDQPLGLENASLIELLSCLK
ncbi:MAG: hypothetical protein ACI9MC_001251 [Kiritimatiellia bacterium]